MSETSKKCHAFQNDALGHSDGVELAQRLRNKEVSLYEVTEAAIRRARSVEDSLHAIEFPNFGPAMESQYHDQGFFAGVPTFIKDNTPVTNLPTNHGSDAVTSKPERESGPYAKQFLSLGFNLLGKSTLPEFGLNATTEPLHRPVTCNPWHIDFSSGASSGGSAALVAAGVVPLAHGNDGGGSIRIPAACCGLVGLKPSRRRHIVSRQARSLPINIVGEGVLTRTVRDTAYFHHETQHYYRNAKLPNLPLIKSPAKTRLKVGLISSSLTGFDIDEETRTSLEQTAENLIEMKHQVDEIPFPVAESFAEDFALYWAMMAFALRSTGKLSVDTSFTADRLDPFTHGLADHYKKQIHKTPQCLFRLKQHAKQFQDTFKRYDVLLSPVLAQTTAPLGHISPEIPFDELFQRLLRYVGFTPMANVAGTPAISLPLGLSTRGLPIGMQFCAGMGQEQTLLELAYELETTLPWKNLYEM